MQLTRTSLEMQFLLALEVQEKIGQLVWRMSLDQEGFCTLHASIIRLFSNKDKSLLV